MTSRNIGSAVLVIFVVRRLSSFVSKGSIQQDGDFDHDLIFNILRTALWMVVTTNLQLVVLWTIAKFALSI